MRRTAELMIGWLVLLLVLEACATAKYRDDWPGSRARDRLGIQSED